MKETLREAKFSKCVPLSITVGLLDVRWSCVQMREIIRNSPRLCMRLMSNSASKGSQSWQGSWHGFLLRLWVSSAHQLNQEVLRKLALPVAPCVTISNANKKVMTQNSHVSTTPCTCNVMRKAGPTTSICQLPLHFRLINVSTCR